MPTLHRYLVIVHRTNHGIGNRPCEALPVSKDEVSRTQDSVNSIAIFEFVHLLNFSLNRTVSRIFEIDIEQG